MKEIIRETPPAEGAFLQESEAERDHLDTVLGNLPEVLSGRDLWQNDFHEFDVLGHTQEFVEQIARLSADRNIRAAGWLHDIGKPVVATPKLDKQGKIMEREPGKPYHEFTNHEIVGEEMVKKMPPELFTELGLDQEKVASLVGCHYLPMKGIKAMRKTENFADFKAAFNQLDHTLSEASVSKEEILDMFVADKLAQGKFCTDRDELFAIRKALLNPEASDDQMRQLYDLQKQVYGNKE